MLQQLQDQALVGSFVSAVVEGDRTRTLPGGGDIARTILGSHLARLRLGNVDLCSAGYITPGAKESRTEVDRCFEPIETCLKTAGSTKPRSSYA